MVRKWCIKLKVKKNMMTEKYTAPEVLIVECEVEKGFAVSLGYGGEYDDVIADI